MTVYFIFGKTGVGKSHIGQLLEGKGILHIDGDKYITEAMKSSLKEGQQITEPMIALFVTTLANVISEQQLKTPEMPFVVSQALYINKYRCFLSEKIPDLKFVKISTSETLRETRIVRRHREGESQVSLAYARKMDPLFEQPTHDYIDIKNDGNDAILLYELEQKMGLLFLPSQVPVESLGM